MQWGSDKEAVEDLLIARANADCAPIGLEPPLCVAVRHRMGDIAKVLLSYHADVGVRSQPTCPNSEIGSRATESAAEDPASGHAVPRMISGSQKSHHYVKRYGMMRRLYSCCCRAEPAHRDGKKEVMTLFS